MLLCVRKRGGGMCAWAADMHAPVSTCAEAQGQHCVSYSTTVCLLPWDRVLSSLELGWSQQALCASCPCPSQHCGLLTPSHVGLFMQVLAFSLLVLSQQDLDHWATPLPLYCISLNYWHHHFVSKTVYFPLQMICSINCFDVLPQFVLKYKAVLPVILHPCENVNNIKMQATSSYYYESGFPLRVLLKGF